MDKTNTDAQTQLEECLERIDRTRALLESQLTELHGLCVARVNECRTNGGARCYYDLHGLSGHLMGMTIVALRLDGATADNIRTLLAMSLKIVQRRDAP